MEVSDELRVLVKRRLQTRMALRQWIRYLVSTSEQEPMQVLELYQIWRLEVPDGS